MSKPVSAFHTVPKLNLQAAVLQPSTAKETAIAIRKQADIKCMICSKIIIGKAYTEILQQILSKEKESICSSACFHKWTKMANNSPIATVSPLVKPKTSLTKTSEKQ